VGAAGDADQLLKFKNAKRLADRRPGYLELLDQLRFCREIMAGGEFAGDDLTPDRRRNNFCYFWNSNFPRYCLV
jgi:hypothetical protein